ncbi:MAG: ABC transporter permease [Burkholderiales bacterium]
MSLAATLRATAGGALDSGRGRLALSIAAIALGVALGYAIHTVNRTAVGEFASGIATLAGRADWVIRGPADGFDENVYPRVARLAGVAVASPLVEVDARVPGRQEPLRVVGLDAMRAAAVTPALVGVGAPALDLLRPDRVYLSAAARSALGLDDGDTLTLQAGTGTVAFVVAGRIDASAGRRIASVDIAAAQDAFGRSGRLTRIDVRVAPGVASTAVREAIAATLPPGVHVSAPTEEADTAARMTRAYRVNLDVLALVALFTGALLVFTTQALAVARRRSALALLRALGLERRRLAALVIAEGAAIGLAGGLAGVAAGHALAAALLRALGGDLGAGFFRGESPSPTFSPGWAATFAAAGVLAAIAGAWLPAREAALAAPAAALKAGDDESVYARLGSPLPGLACLGTAALLVTSPPIDGLPLAGYASIALALIGTLLLLPRLARAVLARVGRPRAPAGALALDSLRAAPGQASVSLAAIVAAVALAASMAIMVASFRQSLGAWLDRVLPADLYVRSGSASSSAWIDAHARATLLALPGVRRADFLRSVSIAIAPGAPPVTLLARDLDPARAGERLALVGDERPATGGMPPAWISEAWADTSGARPGDVLTLPIGGREARFAVAGVFRDYSRQTGAIVIERATWTALSGDDRASDAALWLAPGAALGDLREAIAQRFGDDRLVVATPGEIRAISLAIFDRTFAVTWAMEAIAVAIGLAGLSASFGAIALARRREFGVLRHLGMTRSQIGAMLAWEGALVGAAGLAIGYALGAAISVVLVHVVNRQSFRWSMDLHLPAVELAVFGGALVLLAALTARASAARATADDAVVAVKDDW